MDNENPTFIKKLDLKRETILKLSTGIHAGRKAGGGSIDPSSVPCMTSDSQYTTATCPSSVCTTAGR